MNYVCNEYEDVVLQQFLNYFLGQTSFVYGIRATILIVVRLNLEYVTSTISMRLIVNLYHNVEFCD